jgi:peptide/nickel transport system permease protein
MNKKAEEKNWKLSYSRIVWRRFTKSRLNLVCLIFVLFLFLLAVFAPFIANDKPFVIRIDGKLYFPLFRNLQPSDYCIFLAAALTVWYLLRRTPNGGKLNIKNQISKLQCKIQKGMPDSRYSNFAFLYVILLFAFLFLIFVLIFVFVPRRLDAVDYKEMVASGKATGAIFTFIPYGYARTELASCRQPPSRRHWLGTDDVGADVLCRLIHGSRISLSVGFVAVGISVCLGILVGAILGYFGGWVDFVGMRFVEIMMAIPVFFLIITITAFFPRSFLNIMIIIGVTGWTSNARFIRAEFFKLRRQDFVQAAVSLGLPLRSILFGHILPNAVTPVLVNATFGISSAIFIEAALSFLGFGVAPPMPSWGQILSLGVSSSGRFLWWLTLFPGLAIFFTVMAYNVIGEGLRDATDPRLVKK